MYMLVSPINQLVEYLELSQHDTPPLLVAPTTVGTPDEGWLGGKSEIAQLFQSSSLAWNLQGRFDIGVSYCHLSYCLPYFHSKKALRLTKPLVSVNNVFQVYGSQRQGLPSRFPCS